ncbi:hypothetical protein C4J81_04130 [Deltaproteobacteria bacterium Smac51]|nr:hypothetical protein C4J81_04130 [Deltaproteobacteria bacterium Smac51]
MAFGDSFSDNGFGNGHGFERYSNTFSWVEYLTRLLGLGSNHDVRAWGGAMSDHRNCNVTGEQWSGLSWQIDEYLESLSVGTDIPTVLFTIKVGSNDFWGGQTDPAVTAANIRAAMIKLAEKGARHILYRETSAVIMAPGYLSGEWAHYGEGWAKQVNCVNAITRDVIRNGLPLEFPSVNLYYHETDPVFTKIKHGEKGFEFKIFDVSWKGTFTFPKPNLYMWWDDFHPMGEVHRLWAEDSYEAFKSALK